MDGEIEGVGNPVNPSAPSLFRFVVFKATEKVSHKKKVETDKAKDDTNDFDITFDAGDLGWAMKANKPSIAEHSSWRAQSQFGELCNEQYCQCQWSWCR